MTDIKEIGEGLLRQSMKYDVERIGKLLNKLYTKAAMHPENRPALDIPIRDAEAALETYKRRVR